MIYGTIAKVAHSVGTIATESNDSSDRLSICLSLNRFEIEMCWIAYSLDFFDGSNIRLLDCLLSCNRWRLLLFNLCLLHGRIQSHLWIIYCGLAFLRRLYTLLLSDCRHCSGFCLLTGCLVVLHIIYLWLKRELHNLSLDRLSSACVNLAHLFTSGLNWLLTWCKLTLQHCFLIDSGGWLNTLLQSRGINRTFISLLRDLFERS